LNNSAVIDFVFDTLAGYLPFPARIVLQLVRRLIEAKLKALNTVAQFAVGTPDQLRNFVTWLLELIKDDVKDVPVLGRVYDTLVEYATGPVLDYIWTSLVGDGVIQADADSATAVVLGTAPTPMAATSIESCSAPFVAAVNGQ